MPLRNTLLVMISVATFFHSEGAISKIILIYYYGFMKLTKRHILSGMISVASFHSEGAKAYEIIKIY
jgi:hypothetical protein